MRSVFLVLSLSYSCGEITSDNSWFSHFFHGISPNAYAVYCFSVFFFSALVCYSGIMRVNISNERYISALLIGILCFCMCISSVCNLFLLDKDLYFAAKPYVLTNSFSWAFIYQTIELSILFLVFVNGASDYIYNRLFPGNGSNTGIYDIKSNSVLLPKSKRFEL